MTSRGIKIRDAFRKKYGVDHPSQLQSVKDKKRTKRENGTYKSPLEKMKKTNLEKYGVEFYGNPEKGKKTKLKKYGDENYNNREKMGQTNLLRYGARVSPNITKSTIERTTSGEIGFNSKKYKKYLLDNGVTNVSQISEVRRKKSEKNIRESYINIVSGSRLENTVEPLFSENEYSGTEYHKLYKFRCVKCNAEFNDNLYSGNTPRCLICNPLNRFTSVGQKELLDFIKTNCGCNVIHNDRKILDGLELDIYIPDKNLAIEYNGVYWHSEISGNKPKNYHINKLNECAKKGIQLIHIFDEEWEEKQDIIKSIILAKLKKTETIYARNLIIKEVSNSDKELFLEKNHIQGSDVSKVRFGLYDKSEELLSLMTFCKSRYDKKIEWEMSRFCTKLNIRIVGGASKLFSHFIKTKNPISIVSYSDKRLFNGKIYETLGMGKRDDSPPSYYYTRIGRIIGNRITFQKHKLKKILPIFDGEISEWKNMQNNGFDRVWDCGNLKYVWQKP